MSDQTSPLCCEGLVQHRWMNAVQPTVGQKKKERKKVESDSFTVIQARMASPEQ